MWIPGLSGRSRRRCVAGALRPLRLAPPARSCGRSQRTTPAGRRSPRCPGAQRIRRGALRRSGRISPPAPTGRGHASVVCSASCGLTFSATLRTVRRRARHPVAGNARRRHPVPPPSPTMRRGRGGASRVSHSPGGVAIARERALSLHASPGRSADRGTPGRPRTETVAPDPPAARPMRRRRRDASGCPPPPVPGADAAHSGECRRDGSIRPRPRYRAGTRAPPPGGCHRRDGWSCGRSCAAAGRPRAR